MRRPPHRLPPSRQPRAHGYSLVELVIVIVILGIIGVGLFSIYTTSIRQYIDASRRAEMTASARLALERISRELRNALPNSVRVSSDGNCVEFRPVLTAAVYAELPISNPASSLTASAFTLPAGSWAVSVMPLQTSDGVNSDMYGSAPLTTVGITAVSAPDASNLVTVSLAAAHQFPRTSPSRRLYVVGGASSFCITAGGQLRRYSSYSSTVNQPPLGSLGSGDLLAENISPGDSSAPVFRYFPGSLERNAVLDISLLLRVGDESLRYAHEVQIRNVP